MISRSLLKKSLYSSSLSCSLNVSRTKKSIFRDGFGAKRAVGYWFMGGSALVFGIVVLGGLTRLTESGLSMHDWRLLHFRAPTTEKEWENYFEEYKTFADYQSNHDGISLDKFKSIYWMEHAHRVYGRLLGLYIVIPSLVFAVSPSATKRRIIPSLTIRRSLAFCNALVIFQGALGWWMVKSGLRKKEDVSKGDRISVSAHRLAAHLSSAVLLYIITLNTSLKILSSGFSSSIENIGGLTKNNKILTNNSLISKLRTRAHGSASLVLMTLFSGAYVAGLDAGMIYNTFPLMGNRVVPSDLFIPGLSVFENFSTNPTAVQFVHRGMAILSISAISEMWIKGILRGGGSGANLLPEIKKALHLVMGAAWAQGSLGVLTLLFVVPIPLASAHQGGSLVLIGSILFLIRRLKQAASSKGGTLLRK